MNAEYGEVVATLGADGLGCRDGIHLAWPTPEGHRVDGMGEGVGIGQKGGDVLEKDSRFWKVRNIANERSQIHEYFTRRIDRAAKRRLSVSHWP